MTIETGEIDWEFEWWKAAIDVRYARIATDIPNSTHTAPRTARQPLRKSGDYIPFVEVNMDKCCNGYSLSIERRVDENDTPNLDPLAYEISEGATVGVPNEDVVWFNKSRKRFGNASI